MRGYLTRRKSNGEIEPLLHIGSDNNWLKVRREEMLIWRGLDAGAGLDVDVALRIPNIPWRFPWPSEDQQVNKQTKHFQWDMLQRREVNISYAIRYEPPTIRHGERFIDLRPEGGGIGMNVWMPCPRSQDFKLRSTHGYPLALIWAERYDEQGRASTLFRCGWCQTSFTILRKDLQAVRDAVLVGEPNWMEPNSWWKQVANRIKARPD